jgi:hypothetical protein
MFGRWFLLTKPKWVEWVQYRVISPVKEAWRSVAKWVHKRRASRARKKIRALPCKGKHPTSVLSDGTCEECHPLYEVVYPQGWSYYPGDRCEHGVYVGGVGVDHMCHACEMGW